MPFNDTLDVRVGNEQRKRKLAQLAQKLATMQGRSAGMASLARAGGGLGRQNAARFRPLAQRNMGVLSRLSPFSDASLGQAIGRFGLVERQPGAYDAGAGVTQGPPDVPDLGGSPTGNNDAGGITWGNDRRDYRPDGRYLDTTVQGGVTQLPQASAPQAGPPGYVMYNGVPIPIAVWKTLQSEL